MLSLGICGLGVVGKAMETVFRKYDITIHCYDKYQDAYTQFDPLRNTDLVFLALPTPFSKEHQKYDLSALHDVLGRLNEFSYQGLVVIKSTVTPGTLRELSKEYPSLTLLHNPEFLSAQTAVHDFEQQKHIVIGADHIKEAHQLRSFYQTYWQTADYSICTWEESELMKISCNAFYAVKIQFLNEIYQLARASNCSYEKVIAMMLRNGWIAPQHTQVPGPDGKLSYGGMCFPKDTQALLQCMIQKDVPHGVLEATITERNQMR